MSDMHLLAAAKSLLSHPPFTLADARALEALEEEDEMELEGPVEGGRIWGYVTSDGSLAPFEGRWLELECRFDGMRLSQCREDD